nr:MAG TPA: hypothetical protein [Caudoviricetes sp.]
MDILSITSLCSQTISSTINLLPISSSLPFPLSCTLLIYSYRYFFYIILSIVVEPYSCESWLLIVHFGVPSN